MRHLLCAFAVALLLALAACGGSSSQDSGEVLPDGPDDPRAYTEQFLSLHPRAVLRPGHTVILTLEPTQGAEDTGTQDGGDVVTYQFDTATALDLRLDASADRVGAIVLRDASGREEGRVTAGTIHIDVHQGRHTLEIHHLGAGNPSASTQVVFLRPTAAPGAGLEASANCTSCNFDNGSITGQTFDGLDLSRSTFDGADVESSSFVGAELDDTSWTAATLRNDDFTNASMQAAELCSDVAVQTSIFSCTFVGADLTGARFDNSDLFNATFGDSDPTKAANLSNTSWRTLDDPCFVPQLSLVDFRNVNLSGAKFLGTSMMGVDFSGAAMNGANLTGGPGECDVLGNRPVITTCDVNCVFGTEPNSGQTTDLSNAILASSSAPSVQLAGQKLSGVALQKAQLTAGEFDNYDFSGSDLTGADLTGAQINGGNLQATTLNGADLTSAQLNGANLLTATLAGATLTSTQLNGANLDNLDLHGLTMEGTQLNGAFLNESNLEGTVLDNASLIGARLGFANLKNASLRGVLAGVQPGSSAQVTVFGSAYMVNVDLTDADLRSADLSSAHLYGTATLVNTLLDSADLTSAICAGAKFSGSLNDTIFNKTLLVTATFNGADLTDAKFDSAYLQGADFSTASTVLSATLYNAAVSTENGFWTYTEQNGAAYTFEFGPTNLGAFTSDPTVICPNNASGPCNTPASLTPVMNGPFPPIPPCVPTYQYCYDNCLDPPMFNVKPPNCGE